MILQFISFLILYGGIKESRAFAPIHSDTVPRYSSTMTTTRSLSWNRNANAPLVRQQAKGNNNFLAPDLVDESHKYTANRRRAQKPPIRDAVIELPATEQEDSFPHQQTTTTFPKNPTPVLVSAFNKAIQQNQKSNGVKATVAAAALALALTFTPNSAEAAMSGGRMGGSFSAPRSSSSRITTSPGSSFSRGYSSGYRSGYGSGFYSSPGFSPFVSPFYSPFAVPRPFFYGAPGVITYGRGPGFFDLLVIGGIGFMILNAVKAASAGVDTSSWGGEISSPWGGETIQSPLGQGTSVAQISVAMDVSDRDSPNSILRALDRLASTSKTDSRVGIQNLTSQVALEILRRKSSIVSASTKYKHFNNRDSAQRYFNSQSIQERSKFESETLSRYGGVDYSGKGAAGAGATDGKATMAVVTIMINIDGDSTKLPKIASITDVESALRTIASDAKVSDCLQGAEILWTPEDRFETLTLKDVIADYPELNTV